MHQVFFNAHVYAKQKINSTWPYLGVLLNEHLKWTKQVTQVKIQINQAIGILNKLQNITTRYTLKMIYHSLFGSHLHYGAQEYKYRKLKTI